MTLLRFSLYFLGLTLLVACLAVTLQFFVVDRALLSPYFWLLFGVTATTTFGAYVLSDLGIRRGGELSVFSIIGGLFFKLFACLAMVAVLIIKYPENKMLTAINFFSLYFLFTVFEVTCLLRNLRDQNQT